MRSKLFVPGSRPELFAKALAGEADAICIDLEDSVTESRKAQTRALVGELLRSEQLRASGKVIIVRVNALDTVHFEADIAAIAQPTLALLNLPKAESADDVRAAIAVLERAVAGNGIDESIRILANIETPKGLRSAAQIAAAHPRVAGLQLGFSDLFEPMGIERNTANIHATMFAVRMAAGEAGVFAYDGAFADIQDAQGFQAEAQMARRLGYLGKSCIHPSQIALANEVFRPSEEDLARALQVLGASRQAQERGDGAFVLDGRMIDMPAIRRAEAVLAVSQRVKR